MKLLSQHIPEDMRVLLRTDYNVPIANGRITDSSRITETLPTIKTLLEKNNKIIILSHRGRPDGEDPALSLKPLVPLLSDLLPEYSVKLVKDFKKDRSLIDTQTPRDILILENIRFHKGEEENIKEFSESLAKLGDIYINDAFSVSHRDAASVTGITQFLPSYAGLSLEKEYASLSVFSDKRAFKDTSSDD